MSDRKVVIFGKQHCAMCKTTKDKVGHYLQKWGVGESVPVQFVDVETIDGLTESAFHDVAKIPTTIIEQKDNPVARWEGEVPRSEALRASLGIA